jgi:methionine-rich copper-binding protein CopC
MLRVFTDRRHNGALILALFLGWLLTTAGGAECLAHAIIVENSLPDIVPANSPMKARLRFNSNIEIALTEISLMDTRKTTQRLKITAAGRPGEVEIELPALQPGSYALVIKALSADGHMTRELVRFRVQTVH